MAKSAKTRSTGTNPPAAPETVEDAVVIATDAADDPVGKDESPAVPEVEAVTETDGSSDTPDQATDPAEPETETESLSSVAPDVADTTPEPEAKPEPEVRYRNDEPPQPLPVPAPIQQVTVRKVGFVPLVLGGAVAAGLGFAAAWFWLEQGNDARDRAIAAQTDRIEALETTLAEMPAPVDLGSVETALAQMEDDIGARIDTISTDTAGAIAAFDERLTAVERAPATDGTLAETAIASWERELDGLRAEIAAQQARMQEIADGAAAALQDSRTEAVAVEQQAAEAARMATSRAALARIQAALDAGTPFDVALGDLTTTAQIAAPAALADTAADGVPTITALQNAFPAAAREALATARAEGLAGEEGGAISAFLRNQFDVRSVTPQEGDAPDAVLSRAEAALHDNRLADAMAEVQSLPEVVRASMAGWTALATARADALAAVESLSQSLNN